MIQALLALPAIASAVKGYAQQKKGEKIQQQQMDFAKQQYKERAPMRRQGMQALGQVEAPIDFGSTFQNTSNPFSKNVPSTASYGNWGQYTTSPEQIDQALSGLNPDEYQFMTDALGSNYIGKSGGKQRYGSEASGKEYTNDDRNHAMMLQGKFNDALGYTNMTPQQMMQRTGIQPLGRPQPTTAQPRVGIQPLGGR